MSQNIRTHGGYRIGIICVLELEKAAMVAMLDEHHSELGQDEGDENNYILGKIGANNVAIASRSAGSRGSSSALAIAKHMELTFPIQFHLLVGLGGGVWSKSYDIRLGDVVVGNPIGFRGGVIRWGNEMGTEEQHARGPKLQRMKNVELADSKIIQQPPPPLLFALQSVREKELVEGIDFTTSLSPLIRDQFQYPGTEADLLFRSTSLHKGSKACEERCNPNMVICRRPRQSSTPKIHYGIIASGKSMTCGKTRDKVARDNDAICFDTDSADLVENFSCLVIKGICNYADTHKTEAFQSYAAMTAAAFAREVVSYIDEQQTHTYFGRALLHSTEFLTDGQAKLLERFRTTNYEIDQNVYPDRVPGTCSWVLNSSTYREWVQGNSPSVLWITADPGCGKSVLARSLTEHELRNDDRNVISFFSFKELPSHTQANSQSLACLSAILHQLFTQKQFLLKYAITAVEARFDQPLSFANLWNLLLDIANDPETGEITCVLDALDQCDKVGQWQLIQALDNLCKGNLNNRDASTLKFLVTSRPNFSSEASIRRILSEMPAVHLANEKVRVMMNCEIDDLVESRVGDLGLEFNLDLAIQSALIQKLLSVQNRSHLWLSLVFTVIYKSLTVDSSLGNSFVESIPETVNDSYEAIMNTIPSKESSRAEKLFRIIIAAERPLTLQELNIALNIGRNCVCYEDLDIQPENIFHAELQSLSAGLIIVKNSRVYFVHETAKYFLMAPESGDEAVDRTNLASQSWRKSILPPQSHHTLAKACIYYLLFDVFMDIKIRDDGKYHNLDELYESHNLLEYATKYFVVHLRFAQRSNDTNLSKLALPLCDTRSSCFRLWYDSRQTIADFCDRSRLPTDLMIASYVGLESIVKLKVQNGAGVNKMDTGGYTALMYAIKRNSVGAARILIENGADINHRVEHTFLHPTPLLSAIQKKSYEMAELLINNGADINATNFRNQTPLIIASMMNHIDLAKLLLSFRYRAERYVKDSESRSALWWAANNNNMDMARLLLLQSSIGDIEDYQRVLEWATRHGNHTFVDFILNKCLSLIRLMDDSGNPLLSVAAGKGHDDVVKILLAAGANINEQDPSGGTPLNWAAANGKQDIIRLLLANGATINGSNEGDKRTPLSKAAENGHEAVAIQLIECNCHLDTPDAHGRTPLSWASTMGHERIVRLLLSHGVDPNSKDRRGFTPLLWTMQRRFEAVSILLVEYNADVNVKDENGWLPILYALESGQLAVAQLIIKSGTDLNSSFSFDVAIPHHRPLLFWSVMRGYESFTELLLANGVTIDIHDSESRRTPLSKAAEEGREGIVSLLIRHGADPNFTDGEDNRTPLSRASEMGHGTVVRLLVSAGANFELKDELGRTPLFWAIQSGYRIVVKALLEMGAKIESLPTKHWQMCLHWALEDRDLSTKNILLEQYLAADELHSNYETLLIWVVENEHESFAVQLIEQDISNGTRNDFEQTVLLKAAEIGLVEVVQLLLHRNVEIESRDSRGHTPLLKAAIAGNDAIVKLLLEYGSNANCIDTFGRTPLALASRNGHVAIIQLFINQSVDIEAKDFTGQTPLIWAARSGELQATQLLIETGVNVNDTDQSRRTALWRAAEGGYEKIVVTLLKHGASLEIADSETGHTALSWTVCLGNLAMTRLLLQNEAKYDPGDKNGRSPLSWAAEMGNQPIIKLLVDKGANCDSMDDESGRTPLSRAAEKGHEDIVRFLLSKGSYIDSIDTDYGRTPLLYASRGGHYQTVLILTSNNAEVDRKDFTGRTPLSWAAGNGHEDVVQWLLTEKADLDARDDSGRTALSWAAAGGHTEISQMLRSTTEMLSMALIEGQFDEPWSFDHVHSKDEEMDCSRDIQGTISLCVQLIDPYTGYAEDGLETKAKRKPGEVTFLDTTSDTNSIHNTSLVRH
ncbi:hypothetical protein G7Y89_g9028 [Cudoniella acicularis]|uniref:Nephrocystin 3-like N-terminal domain-containing protein n=1 Tax=Cudoniella acicularis TaxID=354080 RepID=A0A8H4RI37_9HELO|nr:hypothetical protein G7Y89_g9028 [Cudoniella acicularis]